MSAKIIDGKALARTVRAECRVRADKLTAAGIKPGLAVLLVGDEAASRVYVNNKVRACTEVGVESRLLGFPATVTEDEILSTIRALNVDPQVHGIVVQLPLPAHISVRKVLETISHEKDVDGFHLYNVGGLVLGHAIFPPLHALRCAKAA